MRSDDKGEAKRYLVLSKHSASHYSFTYKSRVARLFFSKLGEWTEAYKSKCAVKVEQINDDFEYRITMRGREPFVLDICQIAELREALNGVQRCTVGDFDGYEWVKR